MDNPEKLAAYGTQDEEKKIHNTICVRHHYNKKQSDFDVQFDDLNSTF